MKNRREFSGLGLYCVRSCHFAIAGLVPCCGATTDAKPDIHDRFIALPIAKGDTACARMLYKYGVPFIETAWHAPESGSLAVNVGVVVKKIFLLGMTETQRPSAWSNPLTYAARYIVGDNLGQIRLHYADGSTQDYPLILGESVWWGLPFEQTQEPFPSDARLRQSIRGMSAPLSGGAGGRWQLCCSDITERCST